MIRPELVAFAVMMSGCVLACTSPSPEPSRDTVRGPGSNGERVVSTMLARAQGAPITRVGGTSAFLLESRASVDHAVASSSAASRARRTALLSLRTGEQASDPLLVETTGAGALIIHRTGATATPASVGNGLVRYREAFPGVEALVFPTDTGVEELLIDRLGVGQISYSLDLPPRWRLIHADREPGLVEVRDSTGHGRLRLWAKRAWDATGAEVRVEARLAGNSIEIAVPEATPRPVVIDPEWISTGAQLIAHWSFVGLPDGNILCAQDQSGDLVITELYHPPTGTFRLTGSLATARVGAIAQLLPSGRVLIAGGEANVASAQSFVTKSELYDPIAEEFVPTGDVRVGRVTGSSAILKDGRVLVALGQSTDGAAITKMELYDPAKGSFSELGEVGRARMGGSMTALSDGRVLIVGGSSPSGATVTTEIYYPNAKYSAFGPDMSDGRILPASFLLPSGRVLIAGGLDQNNEPVSTVDEFDPSDNTIHALHPLLHPRAAPIAGVLPNGKILFACGAVGAAAEIYDRDDNQGGSLLGSAAMPTECLGARLPSGEVLAINLADLETATPSSSFTKTFHLGIPTAVGIREPIWIRANHGDARLTDGRVLLAGGQIDYKYCGIRSEVFDPSTLGFSPVESELQACAASLTNLAEDDVLLTTTNQASAVYSRKRNTYSSVLDPPTSNNAAVTAKLLTGDVLALAPGDSDTPPKAWVFKASDRAFHAIGSAQAPRPAPITATALATGEVLVAGGFNDKPLGAELYNPALNEFSMTGSTAAVRCMGHSASGLKDGRVLLAGGAHHYPPIVQSSAEIYDRSTELFSETGSMTVPRRLHSAITLPSGRVLISGGRGTDDTPLSSAEEYDPGTGTFSPVGHLSTPRVSHSSTELRDGRILIVGGGDATAELYDPAQRVFSPITSPDLVLEGETATLLPTGEVLVVGGTPLGSREAALIDPHTRARTSVGSLSTARVRHTATLLQDGTVLITGGQNGSDKASLKSVAEAELYDPVSRAFQSLPQMNQPRSGHAATALSNGHVLITGGSEQGLCEEYLPETHAFAPAHTLKSPRHSHAAVLLGDGQVILAGGMDAADNPLATTELLDLTTHSVTSSEAPVKGAMKGIATASGDAFIGGSGFAWRPKPAAGSFDLITLNATLTLDLALTTIGDVLVSTEYGAELHPSFGVESWGAVAAPEGLVSSTVTRLASSDLLVRGVRANGRTLNYFLRPIPQEAPRPQLSSLSVGSAVVGHSFQITGLRFRNMAAVGSDALPPLANTFPSVLFLPAGGGGPLWARIESWSDTTITCHFDPSPYLGPGWLHVVVDGVPSFGQFFVLHTRDRGEICGNDFECGDRHCVDGVCCDSLCDGACESCLGSVKGSGADGTCGKVPEGTNPRKLCTQALPSTCGLTGACDPNGQCALYAERTYCAEGKQCRNHLCVATRGAPCNSGLDCSSNEYCSPSLVCEPQPSVDPAIPVGCGCLVPATTVPRFPWCWGGALVVWLALFRRRVPHKGAA